MFVIKFVLFSCFARSRSLILFTSIYLSHHCVSVSYTYVIIAGPNVQCMRARVPVAASLCLCRYMSVPESLRLDVCERIRVYSIVTKRIWKDFCEHSHIQIYRHMKHHKHSEHKRVNENNNKYRNDIYAYKKEARSHIHRYTHECDKGIVASHTRRCVCMVALTHVCIRRSNKIFFSSFPYNVYYVESIITFCVYCLLLLLPLFSLFFSMNFFFSIVC